MKISYMKYINILTVLLIMSAWLVPSSAQAVSPALEWREIEKPGEDNNLVVSPSEVSEIAVGRDDVIYALDSANSRIYRSPNAGVYWEDITDNLADEGAGLPAVNITVSPDDSDIVAVVTDNGAEVHLSTDGGEDWTNLGVPGLEGDIQAIAISEEYSVSGDDYRDIAIGTATWSDEATTGQVWVYQMGETFPSWLNLNLAVDPAHTGGDVSAIAYSPDYKDDGTILAVTTTSGDVAAAYQYKTWLCLFERDLSTWNGITGYPVEIAAAGDGPEPEFSRLNSSLALPSDYSSEEEESRQLFVSYDREPDADDDIYSVTDASLDRLNADGGNDIDISSIAYYGTVTSGKLLAGDVSPVAGSLTAQVRRTSDPLDTGPTWDLASVPPTGPGNARVAWSHEGEMAYCGTGQVPGEALDESAFSASLDGDKWRQMGLMDTVIRLADIAPAPDGNSLFITTTSPYGPEGIWRSGGDPLGERWERLLTMDTDTDSTILRLSLYYEDDDTIYAAEVGGDLMAVSYNRGNSWEWCRSKPGPVIDMAVGDEDTIYVALPAGYIRKSINGAFTWQGIVYTHLPEVNMFTLVDEETILVGGRSGDVAYSTDNGASFTKINGVIGSGTGDVQVVADANFPENDTIYAATNLPDGGIWRWVIGVSEEWEQIDESITDLQDGQSIGGLTTGPEGTLYALRIEPVTSSSGGIVRSLNPREAEPEDVEFDLVNDQLPDGATFDPTLVFPTNTIPYLKLSGNDKQNEFWTVDTEHETIYRSQDTLCKAGPEAIMPEPGDTMPTNASGYVTSLTLGWEELEGTKKYEAAIYQDADAGQEVWSDTTKGTALNAIKSDDPAQLFSGTTYHWRVRAIEPVKSPWSEMQSLTPALNAGQWSPMAAPSGISPSPGATNVSIRPSFSWQPADWAAGYELILARDSEFTDVVVAMVGADALSTTVWGCDRDLDYATTYFWKVRATSATSSSEWGTGVFTTKAAPSPAPQPQNPAPTSPSTSATPTTPTYVYGAILIGAFLVIALLILILRTFR
jgi:photosystem II stability/assembly factor-like uncharacterized protein